MFADAGSGRCASHFAPAMALNPDDLTPEHLFDVLDAVAVRRTRPFVKQYYPNDRVDDRRRSRYRSRSRRRGRRQGRLRPRRGAARILRPLRVAMGAQDRGDGRRADRAGGGRPARADLRPLRAVPVPTRRRRGAVRGPARRTAPVGLLKRFESSAYAFGRTCRKMAESHDDFLGLLDDGQGRDREDAGRVGGDRLRRPRRRSTSSSRRNGADLEPLRDYDVDALRADVEHDRELLLAFAEEVASVDAGRRPEARGARRRARGDRRARRRRRASARTTRATSARCSSSPTSPTPSTGSSSTSNARSSTEPARSPPTAAGSPRCRAAWAARKTCSVRLRAAHDRGARRTQTKTASTSSSRPTCSPRA